MAERPIRKTILASMILGLVSQTSLKKRGRLPSALIRSFQVRGTAAAVEVFALIEYHLKVSLFLLFSFHVTHKKSAHAAIAPVQATA
jgi:hypothetical protein